MKIISGTNWNRLSVAVASTSILGMASVMASPSQTVTSPSPTTSPGYTESMNVDATEPTPTPTPGTEIVTGPDLEGRVGGLETRVTIVEHKVGAVVATPTPSTAFTPIPQATPKPHLDPCKFPDSASFYAAGGSVGEMCTAWPK